MSLRTMLGRFLLCSMLLSACCLRAQEGSCIDRTIPISVRSPAGTPLAALKISNFVASFHRKPVKILSVTKDAQPRRVILLVDTSSSMLGDEKVWNSILDLASEFLTQLPAKTAVGLASFYTKIEDSVPLTTNRETTLAELRALRTNWRRMQKQRRLTALWDGIDSSLTSFGTLRPGDVIYVMSDGEDNSSKRTKKDVERRILASGVRVFAFEFVNARVSFSPPGLPSYKDVLFPPELSGSVFWIFRPQWEAMNCGS